MPNLLVQFTENDKRFFLALALIIILLFVICGYIGMLIVRTMKWQGKKIDTLVHDAVVTKVVTNRKHLLAYGRKKNWRCFFEQARIPLLICIADIAFLLIYDAIKKDFSYNPFSMDKGFGSLFFTFEEDGFMSWWIFAFKKYKVTHYPTFIPEAWPGYIFCPIIIIAGVWYLVTVQCLISRTIRLQKLSKTIFEKSLEGYNQNAPLINEAPQNEPTKIE